MSCKHPKEVEAPPPGPFPSEASGQDTITLEQMRKASGDLPDQPPDNPVQADLPFKNLRTA